MADSCECGNELAVSVKYGEFLDELGTSQLLTKWTASGSLLEVQFPH